MKRICQKEHFDEKVFRKLVDEREDISAYDAMNLCRSVALFIAFFMSMMMRNEKEHQEEDGWNA